MDVVKNRQRFYIFLIIPVDNPNTILKCFGLVPNFARPTLLGETTAEFAKQFFKAVGIQAVHGAH